MRGQRNLCLTFWPHAPPLARPRDFARDRPPVMPYSPAINPPAPIDENPLQTIWLEVRRGRTRAPRRAVRRQRFLIGAGSNCQLQLGGSDIPILHSILLVDED